MIDKKFSTKLLKAILRRGQGLSDHNLIHPEREWLTGIGIALITLVTGSFWSFNLYLEHTQTTPHITETNPSTDQVYREGDIKRSLEELAARKNQNDLIRQSLERQPILPAFVTIPTETTVEKPAEEPAPETPTATSSPATVDSPVTVPAQAL